MKTNNKIKVWMLAASTVLLCSCEFSLDKMPDNRSELDSKAKVSQLLVSAYPTCTFIQMAELMSDNTIDQGKLYNFRSIIVEQSYKWQDITEKSQDSRVYLWNNYYRAIASANHALQYINSAKDKNSMAAQKAEALLCRAYSHFILVNMFCQHYNEVTSKTDLGIPYAETPETQVLVNYPRETVAAVYEKINRDIEEALPLISDSEYNSAAIKYHFNQNAAYAFAARFNLFYQKYDKVIQYATHVLGNDPQKMLRDYNLYTAVPSAPEVGTAYIKEDQSCNLLLIPAKTSWPRTLASGSANSKYTFNFSTLTTPGPWGSLNNLTLSRFLYKNGEQNNFIPKLTEFFEYTDQVAGIGYINIISAAFCADETLLCRAEAYVMKNDFTNATADLTTWYNARTESNVTPLTEAYIEQFYSAAPEKICPAINPKFEVTAGKQLNFIKCVLHFRRVETIHEGLRWFDIKRYGIEVSHPFSDGTTDVLTKDDLRRAVQIPSEVITAGMIPNPR